jgi:hypothetical protein
MSNGRPSLIGRFLVVLIWGALSLTRSADACEASRRAGSTGEARWDRAIRGAAAWAGVPPELLTAIVEIESGGRLWALNVAGSAVLPCTYTEAVALVRTLRGRADIGLAQIHYPVWGPVLGLRPEDLLDPWTNLHIAARILRYAMDQEPGSWGGVGRYHSATLWRKWQYAGQIAAVARVLREPRVP